VRSFRYSNPAINSKVHQNSAPAGLSGAIYITKRLPATRISYPEYNVTLSLWWHLLLDHRGGHHGFMAQA
jgi:hypothetical protein